MAAKQRIVLPTATINELARGDGVGRLGGSEQRHFRDEGFTVEVPDMNSGLRLLSAQRDCQEEKQEKRAKNVQGILPSVTLVT